MIVDFLNVTAQAQSNSLKVRIKLMQDFVKNENMKCVLDKKLRCYGLMSGDILVY